MSTKKLVSCVLATVFSLPAWAASATCDNPVGTWTNQLHSTLTVKSVDATNGLVLGQYESPSGTNGQKFPVVGWFNNVPAQAGMNNAILLSFSVNWGLTYGSITSWSGLCNVQNGVPTLTALWQLARANSQFSWDHVLAGQDVFTPEVPKQ